MGLTVSEVAKLANVSVRTLHHYDEIGLLKPSARSAAGYRLYGDGDLERLQQVLFFRELGFALEEIRRIVEDPQFDVRAALAMQRELLRERLARTHALVAAVEAALEAVEKGKPMTPEERFQVFGDFDPEQYEEETKQRWGETEAYRQSKRRAKRYGKREWEQIKSEMDRIQRGFAAHLEAGRAAADPAVMDLAEEHRLHLQRWFYDCPRAMHRGLGELYVSDPRFTANIDQLRPGLAQFMCDAFRANSGRKAPGSK